MPLLAALAVFSLILVLFWRNGPTAIRGRQLESELRRVLPKRQETNPILVARIENALRLSGLQFGARQVLMLATGVSLLLTVVAYRLLGSLPVGLVIGSLGVAWPMMKLRQFEHKRRDTLALQFKEALTSITYSLKAGASLNTALEQALVDLRRIFPTGSTEPIVHEFEELVQQLRLGVPVEAALVEWEQRLQLEDITDFVAATLAVKTRGGNLADVMASISETISWKIVAQAQIRALTAEKRSEANLLIAAPAFVLVVLAFLSPQYMAPLFDTTGGQTVLLLAVLCNVLAFFAVRKVLESPL